MDRKIYRHDLEPLYLGEVGERSRPIRTNTIGRLISTDGDLKHTHIISEISASHTSAHNSPQSTDEAETTDH